MSEEALVQEEQQQEEQPQELTVEDKAREQGWRPQEEWEGSPEDWVDARQFVLKGELFDRIKTQNREQKKLQSEIANLKQGFQEYQEHARKLAEAEYKQQIEQLKSVKKQALEENDYDTVVEADEKMADLKEEQKKAPPPAENDTVDPVVQEWLAKPENAWYKEDVAKRGAADALADTVRQEYPEYTLPQILEEVSKRVEASFGSPGARRNNVSPMTGTAQGGRPAKRAFGKSDLNEEQLKIGQRFVKAGAVKSLKEYAAQLAEIGEIQR